MPPWINDVLNNATLANAFGAAVGGFLGVLIFFGIRFTIELVRAWPRMLRKYSCAHAQNTGTPNEYEGQLMHHHGSRVTDINDLKKIKRTLPVWEWNKTPCGRSAGTSIIYGPYTTDYSEPGEYKVSFTVRAFGISKESELNHDPIILEFDVTRTTPEYAPTQAGIANFDSIITVARHFVRASDLAKGKWITVPLQFFATGEGVWEYRIFAYDGVSKSPDNLSHFGQNIRLFFDTVSISRVRKMQIPWG